MSGSFYSDAVPSAALTSMGGNVLNFRQLLKSLDDGLGSEDCHKLKFLVADLGISKTKLERMRYASDIFDELETMSVISEDEVGFLWELIDLIHRKDLLKIIDAYCRKNSVSEKRHGNVSISKYRLLLLTVADNTSSSELNSMKQACKDHLSRQAIGKVKDVYQLYSLLEESELVTSINLKFLYALLEFAGNKQMLGKIKHFLNPNCPSVPSDDELAGLRSRLGTEWRIIATYLDLNYHTIQAIDRDFRKTDDKIMEMLMKWRQTVSPSDDGYAKLCQALESSGRMDLSHVMKSYADRKRQKPAQPSSTPWSAPTSTLPSFQLNQNVGTSSTQATPHLMKPSDFQPASSVQTHSAVQEMGSLLQTFNPQSSLDLVLRDLSEHIPVEWGKLATFLNMDHSTISRINEDYTRSDEKAFAMLTAWRHKLPDGADVITPLASALKVIGRVDLSERLKAISPASLFAGSQIGQPGYQPQPAPQPEPLTVSTKSASVNESLLVSVQPSELNSENLTVNVGSMDIEDPKMDTNQEPTSNEQSDDSYSKPVEASLPRYRMDRNPRGICLIINNVKFKKYKDRAGSDVDADALEDLFNSLHFTVYKEDNLTSSAMISWLKNISEWDHSEFDCFTCCILSHGALGQVHGTDSEAVEIQDMLNYFKGVSCSSLRGKPKMFFIQACQGTEHQGEVNIQTDDPGIGYGMHKTLPNEADFLLSYATVPGYVSYRDKHTGTWFIQVLVDEIKKHHKQHHIITILTLVNQRLSESVAKLKIGNRKQMPAPSFTLLKELYLPSLEY